MSKATCPFDGNETAILPYLRIKAFAAMHAWRAKGAYCLDIIYLFCFQIGFRSFCYCPGMNRTSPRQSYLTRSLQPLCHTKKISPHKKKCMTFFLNIYFFRKKVGGQTLGKHFLCRKNYLAKKIWKKVLATKCWEDINFF